jgi:hypothetical protein
MVVPHFSIRKLLWLTTLAAIFAALIPSAIDARLSMIVIPLSWLAMAAVTFAAASTIFPLRRVFVLFSFVPPLALLLSRAEEPITWELALLLVFLFGVPQTLLGVALLVASGRGANDNTQIQVATLLNAIATVLALLIPFPQY